MICAKCLMKKFTISFFTAIAVGASCVLGGMSVLAEQTQTEIEDFTPITMEEILDITDTVSPANVEFSSNEDSFLYYDQLDANSKATYNACKKLLKPTSETITVTLPEPITFTSSSKSMSNWTDEERTEFWTLIRNSVVDGETAFEFDYPEVFWYDPNRIVLSLGSYSSRYSFIYSQYTWTVKSIKMAVPVYEKYTDVATATELEDFLAEKIAEFNVEGEDRYSKIKYIHDYIAKTVTYNMQGPYHETAYGLFVEPFEIICEGYSKAVKLFCDKEGIPCVTVIGNLNLETKIAHMWNYIQMEDGKWYGLDCTWDDTNNSSNPVKYTYFLKGSNSFFNNHTEDDGLMTNLVFPEISTTDYVYSSSQEQITTTTALTTTTPTTTTTVTVTTTASASVSKSQTTSSVTSSTHTTTTKTAVSTTTSVVTTSKVTEQTTTETAPTILKGDFNKDGILDTSDIVSLKKKLVGILPITAADYKYELNDDGKLDVWDVVILMRRVLSNK